jgi:hypothetical protein
MLLAFALVFCFTLPFWLWRKEFSRRNWLVVVAFAFFVSLLLACASIWSVLKPNASNVDFHDGEFDGYFPLSKLSYPIYMSVYHTPFERLLYDGIFLSGNVSFTIFITNAKVMEVNGTFHYEHFELTRIPLFYSLDFPLFNDLQRFFLFLLILFTLFNVMGALIGIVSAHTLVKRYKLSHAVNMVLNPMKSARVLV